MNEPITTPVDETDPLVSFAAILLTWLARVLVTARGGALLDRLGITEDQVLAALPFLAMALGLVLRGLVDAVGEEGLTGATVLRGFASGAAAVWTHVAYRKGLKVATAGEPS